jgi:hypothetical protein
MLYSLLAVYITTSIFLEKTIHTVLNNQILLRGPINEGVQWLVEEHWVLV